MAPPRGGSDALALAYQAGHRRELAALHADLAPIVGAAVHRATQRGLPSILDRQDLEQQAWIILADLAQRWRSEHGEFRHYAAKSLPWALTRYVRHCSPHRRGMHVQVVDVSEERWADLVDVTAGEDGRDWDGDLITSEQVAVWREQFGRLPESERSVLTRRYRERRSRSRGTVELLRGRPSVLN